MEQVLLQQLTDGGIILPLQSLPQEPLIVVKVFPRIQAAHFDLSYPFQDRHQGLNPGGDAGLGQHGNVCRLNNKIHQLAVAVSLEAVVGDGLGIDELPRRQFLLLLFFPSREDYFFSAHLPTLFLSGSVQAADYSLHS